MEDCLRRRAAGETLTNDQVLAEHADLLPELEQELDLLSLMERAAERARDSSSTARAISPVGDDGAVHPPRDVLRGYEIVGEVHRGGQGVVYEAIQTTTRRRVAIKVMNQEPFSGRHRDARFEREVQILARLNHPNIVTIHDTGRTSDSDFFVMDYVEGEPLDQWVSTAGGRSLDSGDRCRLDRSAPGACPTRSAITEILVLFVKVCNAVNAAHLRGVIHRDLKPSNILVDAEGQPHVLDFGLAKLSADEVGRRDDDSDMRTRTLPGQFVGSLPWASPEQAEGSANIDLRTDVYSLGVMLYQMLTGTFPYEVEGSLHDVLGRIMQADPVRPRSLNARIGDEIETIILKCLAKDRERRYQSAGELARDIERYLAGEPIEAKRDSGWYVLRKALARYRAAVGIAAGFVVLITAATIALGIMYRGQMVARQAAEQQRRLAESNEARAKDETAKAKAVTTLLQEMLSSASPYEDKGPDYSVRQLLDDFVVGLRDQLTDQPQVEAVVRQTVGNTYQALGLYADAEPQLRTALDIQRRLLEDQHPDVIASRNSLAELLLRTGENAEAEQHLRTALEAAQRCWGDQHEQIATILNNLGLALQAQGAYEEAEALLRETLAMRRQLLGDEHEHVAISLNNLAVVLRIKGDYAGAEPLHREALAIRRRLSGNQHPEVARSAHNLALLLHYRGEYDEAEALYHEALDTRRKILPAGHPEIAISLNSLAGLSLLRGDRDGAETLFREALAIRRKALPAEHPAVARSLSNLGSVLRDKGEYDEAEALYREALAIVRAALPEAHPMIAARLERLALVLVDQQQYAEAEALLRECLAIRQKALPSGDHAFAATESKLGACLTLAGRYDEAEALLLRSHEVLKDCLDDATPAQRMALEENVRRIVQLYEASDRPDQAAEWRAKLPTTQPAEPPPNP